LSGGDRLGNDHSRVHRQQLRTFGVAVGQFLLEHLDAAGFVEGVDLADEVLITGGHAGMSMRAPYPAPRAEIR